MSDDDDSPAWDNTHRAFLQAFLSHQTLTHTQAKPLLAAIQTAHDPARPAQPEDITATDFQNYIHALNNQITPLDLEIRSALHQKTKEQVWCLVNMTSDPIMQLGTVFSAEEMGFVKRLLDAVFEKFNARGQEVLAVTSMQALKLARPAGGRESNGANGAGSSANAGLTMKEAERCLESLKEEGWLELSAQGYHSLSPRALMELRSWLVETYNEEEGEDGEEGVKRIRMCVACKDIVTVGRRCPDLDCEGRLHDGCVEKMWRAQGGAKKCPVCKKDWVNPLPVGEKAAKPSRRETNGD